MTPLNFLYVGIVVPASVSIPIGVAIARYRFIGKPLKTVLFYLIVAGITNGIGAVLAFRRANNLPLLHIYTVVELIFLGVFFYQVINKAQLKKWLLAVIVLFSLAGIVNLLFIQSIYSFNSYTRSLEAVLLIAMSVLYLYRQTGHDTETRWSDRPETWIVMGIVLYFSSSLIQFSFSNIVSRKAAFETKMLIWNIHASLVLVMYLLFTAGFAKCKR